jgi:hypothetical protein
MPVFGENILRWKVQILQQSPVSNNVDANLKPEAIFLYTMHLQKDTQYRNAFHHQIKAKLIYN